MAAALECRGGAQIYSPSICGGRVLIGDEAADLNVSSGKWCEACARPLALAKAKPSEVEALKASFEGQSQEPEPAPIAKASPDEDDRVAAGFCASGCGRAPR